MLKVSTEKNPDSPKTCHMFCRNPGHAVKLLSVSERLSKKLSIQTPKLVSHKAQKHSKYLPTSMAFQQSETALTRLSLKTSWEKSSFQFLTILQYFCNHTRATSSHQKVLFHWNSSVNPGNMSNASVMSVCNAVDRTWCYLDFSSEYQNLVTASKSGNYWW